MANARTTGGNALESLANLVRIPITAYWCVGKYKGYAISPQGATGGHTRSNGLERCYGLSWLVADWWHFVAAAWWGLRLFFPFRGISSNLGGRKTTRSILRGLGRSIPFLSVRRKNPHASNKHAPENRDQCG